MGDRRALMRRLALCLAAAVLAAPLAVQAGEPAVSATAGRAGSVAISLARQTGSSIVIADPRLARRNVPAIRGRMPVSEAVRRLAAAIGGRAVATGARSWRIEPAAARPQPVPAPAPVATGPAPVEAPPPPIVVQASKRDLSPAQIPAQIAISV